MHTPYCILTQQLLRQHGLEPSSIALYPRPTPLSTDLYGWLTMFIRNTAFSSFDDATAEGYMREIVDMCKIDCFWSDLDPVYGSKGSEGLSRSGEPGEGDKGEGKSKGQEEEEGWNLMYVRLRGLAVKPPGSKREP
jgi:hypothetical protein